MSGIGVLLGLTAAAVYGASDFFGGSAAKHVSAFWVLLVSQAAGLLLTATVVGIQGRPLPSAGPLLHGCIAGALTVLALALLYRSLAIGPMVVIAPVAAVLGALVPLTWGLIRGEHLTVAEVVGVVLAVSSVGLITFRSRRDVGTEEVERSHFTIGIPMAAVSGLLLGVVAVLIAETPSSTGLWPLLAWRCTSLPIVVVIVLIMRPLPRPSHRVLLLGCLVGILEVTGNSSFVIGARDGVLALVGVLASLYPISTVILARIRYNERLLPLQMIGLAMAVTGIAFIAL